MDNEQNNNLFSNPIFSLPVRSDFTNHEYKLLVNMFEERATYGQPSITLYGENAAILEAK